MEAQAVRHVHVRNDCEAQTDLFARRPVFSLHYLVSVSVLKAYSYKIVDKLTMSGVHLFLPSHCVRETVPMQQLPLQHLLDLPNAL
jgi:hypothetical protein